jgi:hypothetical protein
VEREITKAEFKQLYFTHAEPQQETGWTADYWNQFFANENDKRYFLTEPGSPDQTRMFISSDRDSHRIFFLSEEEEESFSSR